jgi:N-methylhydantoinase B
VPAGSQVIVRTGGGGGWGDPLERDSERVRWDVVEELISIESAREHYGVVLNSAMEVEAAATAALRRKMRSDAREPEAAPAK